jgi:Cys-rich repeat protein
MRFAFALALLFVGCGEDAEIALEGPATGGAGGRSCQSSEECTGEDRHCALDLGRCVRCLDDRHCNEGQRCSSDHECRRSCEYDYDCGDDHCDLTQGVCVECRNDEDCSSGEYRYCSAWHQCRQCISNDQCDPPKTCDPVEFQCRD